MVTVTCTIWPCATGRGVGTPPLVTAVEVSVPKTTPAKLLSHPDDAVTLLRSLEEPKSCGSLGKPPTVVAKSMLDGGRPKIHAGRIVST